MHWGNTHYEQHSSGEQALSGCLGRVAGVTDRCDWPKEAGSRAKVVRSLSAESIAEHATHRRRSRDRRRSTSSSDDGGGGGTLGDPASVIVDAEALARESPCLVIAPDLCSVGAPAARAVAEVLIPSLCLSPIF